MGAPETSTCSIAEDGQDRLARILDDYLISIERGLPISPDELLAKYPDDAEQLRGYLSGLQLFHAAAGPLPAHAAETIGGGVPQPRETLGDYRLVREIGRGGMGVVYEAWQLSLRRRVALKILPFTVANDARQISRFKNEAQAAAQVQHPNIVPVYGVGEENGVHYYVMQLIEGKSLTSLMDGLCSSAPVADRKTEVINRDRTQSGPQSRGRVFPRRDFEFRRNSSTVLPMRAAETADHVRVVARLAQQAARALHAAHEYGVVHRDVKPSNLLLDDEGKLWVTDFGLARCREDQAEQGVGRLTQTGDVLGTMRYMSPEQALGRAALVDHRTDVYSLGVTMYELATLHHPADDVSDIHDYFRRDRPAPKTLRHWNRHIARDFETIVLKCMAELPHERYGTAKELADDLDRFLEGRPIEAVPPSLLSRAGKWARRRRGVVFATAAVLLVALVGTGVSMTMMAREKAADKERELTQARNHYRQLGEVLNQFTTRYADQLRAFPGTEGLRQRMLQDGLDYYQRFEAEAIDDPSLATDLAIAYGKSGNLSEKIGNKQQALDAYAKASKVWQQKLADDPTNAEFARNLALCQNNMGLLIAENGQAADGLAMLKQACDAQTRLLAGDPKSLGLAADLGTTHGNLGLVLSQAGAKSQALKHFEEAIRLEERLAATAGAGEEVKRSLAASYNNFASLESDAKLAADAYQKAIALQLELVKTDPINRMHQGDLARTYNNLGYLSSRRKDWATAELCYGNAIRLQEELIKASPLLPAYRRDLAISFNNLGMVQSRVGRRAEAEASFKKAAQLQDTLLVAQPNDAQTRSNQGSVWNNLGTLFDQQRRYEDAEKAYQQAITNQRRALEGAATNDRYRALLSRHYINYGRNLARQAKFDVAVEIALARRALWPNQAERLYSVAQQLAATYGAMRTAGAPETSQAACATAAVATLREAIAAGLPNDRLRDASLSAFSTAAEFRALIEESTAGQPSANQASVN